MSAIAADADYYPCGPLPFMQDQVAQLRRRGVGLIASTWRHSAPVAGRVSVSTAVGFMLTALSPIHLPCSSRTLPIWACGC